MAQPTLPIVERITQNVLATLQAVGTPAFGIALSVARSRRQGDIATPGKISGFLKEHDPVPETATNMHKQWMQPYTLLLQAFESDSSDYSARSMLQLARCTAEFALVADITQGGLAINTIINPSVWLDDATSKGSIDAIVVVFDIQYRTLLYNPFSL